MHEIFVPYIDKHTDDQLEQIGRGKCPGMIEGECPGDDLGGCPGDDRGGMSGSPYITSLRAAVMICVTVINTRPHRQLSYR